MDARSTVDDLTRCQLLILIMGNSILCKARRVSQRGWKPFFECDDDDDRNGNIRCFLSTRLTEDFRSTPLNNDLSHFDLHHSYLLEGGGGISMFLTPPHHWPTNFSRKKRPPQAKKILVLIFKNLTALKYFGNLTVFSGFLAILNGF